MGILSALSALGGIGTFLGGATSAYGASQQLSQGELIARQQQAQLQNYKNQLTKGPAWEVQGLKAAGINPMLRYGKGGSMTGLGATSSSQPAYNNRLAGLAAGIGSMGTSAAQINRDLSSAEQAIATASKVPYEIKKIEADTRLSKQQQGTQMADQRRIFQEEMLKYAQYNKVEVEIRLIEENTELVRSQQAINVYREIYEQAQAQVAQAKVPLAQAEAEIYKSSYGQFLRWLDATTKSANPFTSRLGR